MERLVNVRKSENWGYHIRRKLPNNSWPQGKTLSVENVGLFRSPRMHQLQQFPMLGSL